ncbi:hypothetical protein GCM10022222_42500 [Amycolatopsis ultiminotia]|uniref:Uncharacterized protein n=1 Tax=Amycolatopsis ultiminotia TaxID=543629 RepID=A0ABP6WPB1_9PSEU
MNTNYRVEPLNTALNAIDDRIRDLTYQWDPADGMPGDEQIAELYAQAAALAEALADRFRALDPTWRPEPAAVDAGGGAS